MPSVGIQQIGRSRRERIRFWRAGLPPYEGDPHFVVPLLAECHRVWSPEHPFFEHGETRHFVAVRAGRDVGRIAATVDTRHDEQHGASFGFFGWFECERSQETAHALLDSAADWVRSRGKTVLRGPVSYTTNGISGLLVRDDRPGPPALQMAYNPPWYAAFLRDWGLTKAKDLIALWVPTPEVPDARLQRIVERVRKRGRFVIRRVRSDRAGFDADLEQILGIYNRAWERNWGFVPMTDAEFRHEARSMRPVVDPDYLLLAERDGEAVGFSLTLPDMNQALHRIRGRLWPWSVARLLAAKRRIDATRVITLGVLPPWRRSGLDAALVFTTTQTAHRRGLRGGECSWVLEDNELMLATIRQAGGEPYRWYRLFECALR